METQGFYKQDENGEWFYAPNAVHSPTYILLKDNRYAYQLPIDGWDWYDEQPYQDNDITEEI